MCDRVETVPTTTFAVEGDNIIGLKLEGLALLDGALQSIPGPVFELPKLRYLSLAWNSIAEVDPRVSDLADLACLNLSYNHVRVIPAAIALSRLQLSVDNTISWFQPGTILLGNNPIETPPIEIVQKGQRAVADYYASVQQQSRPIHEVKLLLIGHGAAGKTSTVRKLLGEKFETEEPTTDGIRIRPWEVQARGTGIKVNIWDFGGQEMMHATHQFFMSKRSLYLIVLDGRKEDDPEYWLSYVRSFGGDSPVIIVLNKVDENPGYDVDRKFLKDKYPNIVAFHPISCRTGRGIKGLKTEIQSGLSGLPHVRTMWPESWFQVKVALEGLDKDYIGYDAFAELCEAQGIDEGSQRVLVDFLNDLGVVVHFDDPLLRETNVIRPEWVTSAVYVVVTSKELADAHGLLPRATVSGLLSKAKYASRKHDYILELMQKFELCFFLGDEQETLLVPAQLAPNQPEFEFDYDGALAFVFEYDFLPPSVAHKFIVKMYRIIREDLRWRKGVVLYDADFDSEAMVRVDEREKRVQVFVNGARRRDFFAVIYKTFCDIHSGFSGIGQRELVPLPGHGDVFADYQGLLGLEEMGVQEHIDGRLRKRFSVRELLNGIEHERYRTGKRWDVFISYASLDAEVVSIFATRLKREGVRYWLDSEQIRPGDSILSAIDEGLQGSASLVAFFSQHQLKSGWCREEYAAILGERFSNRSQQRMIPVLLDDVKIGDLPITLRGVKHVKYDQSGQVDSLVRMLRSPSLDT